MGIFTYLSDADNVLKGITPTYFGAGGIETDFPLSNLTELPLSKKFRSKNASSNIYITFDLGAGTHSNNTIVFLNHNRTPNVQIVGFYAGLDLGCRYRTSPTSVLTGIPLIAMVRNRYETRTNFAFLSTASADRYWQIILPGDSNLSYFEAGYIMIGTSSALPFQFSSPYRVQRIKRQRYIETEAGAPIVGETVFDSSRVQFSFSGLSLDDADTTEEFVRDLDLKRHPVLIAPTGSDSEEVFFGRLDKPQRRDLETAQDHIRNLSFTTEPMGRSIT